MTKWGVTLFGLGVLAFLDAQFNYGYIFRTVNSVMFMLVALGIFVRIRNMAKRGLREKLFRNNDALRARLQSSRYADDMVAEVTA